MPDWLVKLEGEEHDLEAIEQLLRAADLHVDHEADGYYLYAAALNGLEDQRQVRRRARQILRRVSASEILRCGNSLPIKFTEVVRVEPDGSRLPLGEWSLKVLVSVLGRHAPVSPTDSHTFASWMALAERDPHVGRVLEILSRPDRDWYDVLQDRRAD